MPQISYGQELLAWIESVVRLQLRCTALHSCCFLHDAVAWCTTNTLRQRYAVCRWPLCAWRAYHVCRMASGMRETLSHDVNVSLAVLSRVQDGLGGRKLNNKTKGVFTEYQDRAISLHCDLKSTPKIKKK
jgi:hypothetical protein